MKNRVNPYQRHAAANTVPKGNLLKDVSPRTIARAAQVMLAKRTLTRKRLPVRLDLEPYRSPEFRYDTRSAEQVYRRLQSVAHNARGLRWIHDDDKAVLFCAVHYVPIPYDQFVDRVDISRVGDCFRDVLGINTNVLRRNDDGRPVLQVERIAALAQPNYTAFLGKDELDVYKLEHMQYGPDEQRNWMRTLCSPNESTWADDGYLAFSRVPGSHATRIEFVARQSFPRPRLMTLFRLDRWNWFVVTVTEAAYRRFWSETLDNILKRYEGSPIGVGRPSRREQRTGQRSAYGLAAGMVASGAASGAVSGAVCATAYAAGRLRRGPRRVR
jgi:hypothetical protein